MKLDKAKQVNMYVCGPTVYDRIHIGNARPIIFFDVVRKYLLFKGYDVNYISNITDVDDKIVNKAIELKITQEELVSKTIKYYKEDLEKLNVIPPNKMPKVTEYMNQIINYIEKLIEAESAYEVNGDVYFRVSTIKEYGEISNQKTDDLISGSRIEENDKKENPLDFTLWKKTEVGDVWDSKWSKGRPGWHTECVAMIDSLIGDTIDIHGGGFDLKFPHHENENAQFRALYNKPLARKWMHNGFINIDSQKMSKSLNNFKFAYEVVEEYGVNIVRMIILQSHYKSPINWSDEVIENAKNVINKMSANLNHSNVENLKLIKEDPKVLKYEKDFYNSMDDDFNTTIAIDILFNAIKYKKQLSENGTYNKLLDDFILNAFEIFGFNFVKEEKIEEEYILSMINKRNDAKKNKDFALADKIRDELDQEGIILDDTRDGTLWRLK